VLVPTARDHACAETFTIQSIFDPAPAYAASCPDPSQADGEGRCVLWTCTHANTSFQQICSRFSSLCGAVDERYDETSIALPQQRGPPMKICVVHYVVLVIPVMPCKGIPLTSSFSACSTRLDTASCQIRVHVRATGASKLFDISHS
jgi:hypothetical protein